MADEPNNHSKPRPGEPSGPCIMVVFGAGGDLTQRKLLPALYNLALQKLLPEKFAMVGFGRSEWGHEDYRTKMTESLQEFEPGGVDANVRSWLLERTYFFKGDFNDPNAFKQLKELLEKTDQERGTEGNYLHYLAIAPEFFGTVVKRLSEVGLVDESGGKWRRVVVEKPFGHDLPSAKALNCELQNELHEGQIFRIDHYLGKETVQNILAMRFANAVYEPIWNRRYIDHVQITVAESVGVEMRGGYYDQAGALRDMVPNHIFQLITLTAMEPPSSFDANVVRDEQTKVLRAIPPLTEQEVLTRAVRGQYGEGNEEGKKVGSYRSEPRVNAKSATETFVAMKLAIENWRWADVPFYVRTGKRLKERITEVVIQFRRVPLMLFQQTAVEHLSRNRLVLHIQPKEGISMEFEAKVPGPIVKLEPVNMDFKYADYFKESPSTGYERLLYEAMIGDATLFQRADTVEVAWGVVQPVLDVWAALTPRNFANYGAGTWGPKESDELIERDGRHWRNV
ncbi:MAG TPA: glucose-6-phosphate dehydrogenase [Candidatus Acidoferrales bacterium]|nr:glucose-6-phosphate dehydrogenase [Candidatus Acidoferrales bacterium]